MSSTAAPMSVCAEDATQRGEVCSIANHPTCSELRAPTLAQGDRGDSCVTRGSDAPLTRRRSSGPTGAGERSRGEPAARRRTKAGARRLTSSLVRFGLRITRAMQPSAARGKTAECVALRKRARRRLRRAAGANAIVRPAPGRDDRRDSDVAEAMAGSTRLRGECDRQPGLPPAHECSQVSSARDPLLEYAYCSSVRRRHRRR
jgi:hypothetical protein